MLFMNPIRDPSLEISSISPISFAAWRMSYCLISFVLLMMTALPLSIYTVIMIPSVSKMTRNCPSIVPSLKLARRIVSPPL